ncbi:hypothetical protein HN747_00770 [archaeon]|jgi:hypothetical protein|nr:hypothetical protein [archaeon]
MAEEKNQIPSEQEIPFLQGSLTTLLKEREGLMQMLQVVEGSVQAHAARLKELGVDLTQKKE